ncbi:MAG: putative methyltransferase [Friedmanniella sp.]|nr:putative methyltransferase [Friedmanniella sp.]
MDTPSTPPRRTETYSHGHHASVLRSHRWRTAENSAGYLLPWLQPGHRLLDVGTGPGTITCDLAELLPDGGVLGIDRAETAVRATARLAADRGLANVAVAVGDVYALAQPDAGLDVVHAHQVLQHLADPVAALREMARVTRPGGLVAARDADYGAMTWFPASTALTRWRQLYDEVARSNGGEPDAGRRLRHWAELADRGEVTPSASTWCFATPTDLDWWTSTWAERLTASDFATGAIGLGLSDEAELAALARGWREWNQAPGAWFTVVHGEILLHV